MSTKLIQVLRPNEHLPVGKWKSIVGKKSGRKLLLFHLRNGQFACVDSRCYHMGAELERDIEELGDLSVVECPLHRRKIVLGGNEVIRPGQVVGGNDSNIRCLENGRIVQRTHDVQVKDDGSVWVAMVTSVNDILDSDHYNNLASAEPPSKQQQINSMFRARKRQREEAMKRHHIKQMEIRNGIQEDPHSPKRGRNQAVMPVSSSNNQSQYKMTDFFRSPQQPPDQMSEAISSSHATYLRTMATDPVPPQLPTVSKHIVRETTPAEFFGGAFNASLQSSSNDTDMS